MAILIKNGTLITASETFDADILVEEEKISLIGKDLQHPNADIVDAGGKLFCQVGSIRMCTSTCRCSAQSHRMTITLVTRPPHLAARPR